MTSITERPFKIPLDNCVMHSFTGNGRGRKMLRRRESADERRTASRFAEPTAVSASIGLPHPGSRRRAVDPRWNQGMACEHETRNRRTRETDEQRTNVVRPDFQITTGNIIALVTVRARQHPACRYLHLTEPVV